MSFLIYFRIMSKSYLDNTKVILNIKRFSYHFFLKVTINYTFNYKGSSIIGIYLHLIEFNSLIYILILDLKVIVE